MRKRDKLPKERLRLQHRDACVVYSAEFEPENGISLCEVYRLSRTKIVEGLRELLPPMNAQIAGDITLLGTKLDGKSDEDFQPPLAQISVTATAVEIGVALHLVEQVQAAYIAFIVMGRYARGSGMAEIVCVLVDDVDEAGIGLTH